MASSVEERMQEKVKACQSHVCRAWAGWIPFTNHHRPPSVHWITDLFFFFYIGLEGSTALPPLSRPNPLIFLISFPTQRLTRNMLGTSVSLIAIAPLHKQVPPWPASQSQIHF